MKNRPLPLLLTGLCLSAAPLCAAAPEPPAAPPAHATADAPVPPEKGSVGEAGKFTPRPGAAQPGRPAPPESAIKPLPDGRLQIGAVILDPKTRTVTIPAKVNMTSGVIEYALVMESGKAHESIFTTSATAEHIHIACLLLGISAAQMGRDQDVPADQAVKIEVAWDTNGPEKRLPLSECVALSAGSPDQKTGQTLAAGPWFYAGSVMDYGGFAATREGSLISVISDSTALINNPRNDRENDKIHVANEPVLPRKGIPVRILLTLPPAKSKPVTAGKPPAAEKETKP